MTINYEKAYIMLPEVLKDKFKDYLLDMNIEQDEGDNWHDDSGWTTWKNILKYQLKEFLLEEHNRTYKIGENPSQIKEVIRKALGLIIRGKND